MPSTNGFAQTLLVKATADLAAERERHAFAVAELEETIALLELSGTRTRASILADPDAPDALVHLALTSAGTGIRLTDFRALLRRPFDTAWLKAADTVLREAVERLRTSSAETHVKRLTALVDIVIDEPAWPSAHRVKLVAKFYSAHGHLLERATDDAAVAVLLAMHGGPRCWGADAPRDIKNFARRLDAVSPLWSTIGRAVEAGVMPDPETCEEVRRRLLALEPRVAAPIAAALPPRKAKGSRSLLDRVTQLEDLVAAVTARPPAQSA